MLWKEIFIIAEVCPQPFHSRRATSTRISDDSLSMHFAPLPRYKALTSHLLPTPPLFLFNLSTLPPLSAFNQTHLASRAPV